MGELPQKAPGEGCRGVRFSGDVRFLFQCVTEAQGALMVAGGPAALWGDIGVSSRAAGRADRYRSRTRSFLPKTLFQG